MQFKMGTWTTFTEDVQQKVALSLYEPDVSNAAQTHFRQVRMENVLRKSSKVVLLTRTRPNALKGFVAIKSVNVFAMVVVCAISKATVVSAQKHQFIHLRKSKLYCL